jgi:aminobutyraldehyde dehydrogenase
VFNPALRVLVEINEASEAQVDAAVRAADAFDSWSQTTPKERSLLLLKLADAIEAHGEELAKLESDNCGKPYSRAERRDPGDCRRVPFLRRRQPLHERFGRRRIPARPHLDDPPRPGGRDRLHRAVELPADDGRLENRPALAAGNTVVLKPSEQTR